MHWCLVQDGQELNVLLNCSLLPWAGSSQLGNACAVLTNLSARIASGRGEAPQYMQGAAQPEHRIDT